MKWQMTDEMLVAQAQWLPQYAGEIKKAARRLDDAEQNGTRVKTIETEGAAHRHTATVEEIESHAAEARANAQAANKVKMTVTAEDAQSAEEIMLAADAAA